MPNELPAWLSIPPDPAKLPSWLVGAPRDYNPNTLRGKPPEVQENIIRRFEMAFPTVIDRLWGGETLNRVLDEFPLPVDRGAFMRWVKADSHRHSVYKDAKEGRTEIFTNKMLDVADKIDEGELLDLESVRVQLDIYKWLIPRENKKEYGDTKIVEHTGQISIVAAMAAAKTRVQQVMAIPDDDDEPEPQFRQLNAAIDVDWDDDDN